MVVQRETFQNGLPGPAPQLCPELGIVEQRVKTGLLGPLAAQDANQPRFSRMRPPPRERRVRVTQSTATPDKSGQQFVPFAIDVRWGSDWSENDITGCAYPSTGKLFVKIGNDYRPAEFLLGKSAEPVAGVCQAAST